ncbi:MAG: glycosyltransferase family 4 protein [Ignavibacteria bacterium]
MRLLIAGSMSKFFHLKEFGESLVKLGLEYKLVNDIEIYSGFPSTSISCWFQTLSKFNELVDGFRPDAVFLDTQSHFGLATIKSKIPLIMHLRGDYWSEYNWAKDTIYRTPQRRFALWWKKRIAERCFMESTMILPICNYLTEIVRSRYQKKIVETLYQGIDPSLWYKVEPMDLKHPCVGLLQDANIWGKTKEMLTLTKVLEKLPDLTFYWAGDGPYKDYVLPTLMKHRNFKWLGKLQYPNKIREYLMGIDVYALVSGIDMAPLTLLESQLMEKPVVATNVGGIPELMRDHGSGFLVMRNDHLGWINKLTDLFNDYKKSKQMGNTGRNFVKDNFSWEIIAKKFVNVFKDKVLSN